MSFWRLLLSGLRHEPKEHMPWIKAVAEQQQRVKAETAEVRESVDRLARHAELLARRRLKPGNRGQ